MRINVIISAISIILMSFGALMIIPAIVAIIYQELAALEGFLLSGLIGLASGYIMYRFTPHFEDVHRNEGLVIVALSWLAAAILSAVPYLFFDINILNALFESMSGITTTGATILKDFSLYPNSMFFWRSFTQWLGGMGILVLFIAVLPQFAVGGRQLFFAEAPGPTEDSLHPRIRKTAMYLWTLYIGLTLIEIILLNMVGMPLFDSFCNAFSTMAAGGFSPNPGSIMGYNNPRVEWVIIFFMFLAGASFALQFTVLRTRNFRLLLKNSEFMTYTIIFVSTGFLLAIILYLSNNYKLFEALRAGLFQSISILTTTGFASADFNLWTESAKMVLVLLFFIGGCAGSSGGGIKVVRILILIKYTISEIVKLKHPKAVLTLWLDKQIIPREVLRQILTFCLLYIVLLVISTFVIGVLESDLVVGFSASAATLGNIGPGFGQIGPLSHYADLHYVSKSILIFNMWTGRLEIVAVIMLLSPYIWKDVRMK